MRKFDALASALLATTLLAASTWAIGQQATALPDFNGLWRLSDQGSDSSDQVTAMLRAELRHEQAPNVAPASASSSSSAPQQGSHGHGGGGGRGGMGGGGMGGGGMGGGHGRGGGKSSTSSSSNDSSTDDSLLKPPPMLDNDSVLIVEQGVGAVQARLENGEQLAVPLNGHDQHTLDGNAIVHRQDADHDLQFTLQFNDGSHLDETWSRSADGHTLQVTEQWYPGFLQHPVVFHRNYVRIDQ